MIMSETERDKEFTLAGVLIKFGKRRKRQEVGICEEREREIEDLSKSLALFPIYSLGISFFFINLAFFFILCNFATFF